MLVSMLMVATGVAGALVVLIMAQSIARSRAANYLPELRFDARPHAPRRLRIVEHRRAARR